ncbi:acid-resistance protein [Salmonella enterica subsp. enterica serovar Newport]|nr:acid-resistance protein [Salmonella enterica]EDL3487909.1 acid-resistance protein [Salmonella enterica subsp. enterica serovar Newport]HED0311517.1 acid-resistance protein [Salmonella enterica subsp. enterica serovar Newport]
MNMKKVFALTVVVMFPFTLFSNAFASQKTTSTHVNEKIPGDITCREFIRMNPKARAPVIFWVINRNSDLKEGSFVDWREVETTMVPKMIKQCHQTPQSTLAELIHTIK